MTSNALNTSGWIPLTSAAPIDWLDLVAPDDMIGFRMVWMINARTSLSFIDPQVALGCASLIAQIILLAALVYFLAKSIMLPRFWNG